MRKNRFIFRQLLFLLIFLLAGVVSCTPKKQIAKATLPLEQKENQQLFSDILANQLPFNTLSSKLSLTLSKGPVSRRSKARLKIVADSAIQVSIQPLFGIEVFRLHIDADTLVFLDRMNKRYVKEALSDLKQRYPTGFDLQTLQSLICNRIFVAGKAKPDAGDYAKFNYSDTQNMYYLKSEDKSSGIEYFFSVNADDRIIFTNLVDVDKEYSLQWNYSAFAQLPAGVFPQQMDVSVGSSTKKAEMSLSFSDTVLDEALQLELSIPKSYVKVAFSDVLKILTSDK
ncbi:MAG: DUF4292 domain-containing protein [Dysgonamonadaceae bacterium]|jgi:hypothetical protein|nr:DUF4292 domain-containing protein [Dysgonamonadaceae bacterium]